MMSQNLQKYQRWYEEYPNIRAVFTLNRNVPESTQEALGNALIQMISRYQNLLKDQPLSHEVMWDLSMTQRRRRWFDDVPSLHEAYKMMLVLPKLYLNHLDLQCSNLLPDIENRKFRA